MAFHDIVDLALGLGSITATVGGILLARRLARRDQLEGTVAEQGKDIAHIEGHLETKTGYRSRTR